MEEEFRPGFYRDADGNWQKDRRRGGDRRNRGGAAPPHDRRRYYRRKTDLEILAREAREEIKEALEDFAAEHDEHGHVSDEES